MHNIIINTPRFYVREFTPAEENLYLALYGDEQVTHFINDRSPVERKKRFTEGFARYDEGLGLGRWAIFNQGDHDFIGACRLEPHQQSMRCVELG